MQVLTTTGAVKGGGGVIYDRATSTVDIVSTVAETSLYTKTINGGDLGANKSLRLTLMGDYLHNATSTDTMTFKFKFGGTVQAAAEAHAFNSETNAGRIPWLMHVHVANLGATNSQFLEAIMRIRRPGAGTGATTGIGGWQTADTWMNVATSTLGSADTTANQALDVTGTWSASSASNSWRVRYGLLELL